MGRLISKKSARALKTLALVFVAVVLAAAVFYWKAKGGGMEYPEPIVTPRPVPMPPAPSPVVIAPPSLPMFVIVIDDMGTKLSEIKEIISFGIPVTVAVMPFEKYSAEVARLANEKGLEVILHMPMEPKDAAAHSPGSNAVLTTMTDKEVRAMVKRSIEAVPHVSGLNNHMGSKFTEDGPKMTAALTEVRDKGLFFLDSLTSSESKGMAVSRELSIKAAERSVFLDNSLDKEYIKGQFLKAIKIAKKHGSVIVIGHPHKETLEVIKEMAHVIREEGLEPSRVSDVAR
ncbi:MAG: divergent polysaccharide deacetylase family protein [Deltaproteobacteria bacterium]|nr:divergent polysaccharide deacetylase family protein [Deltaproteobacteria bacterium]